MSTGFFPLDEQLQLGEPSWTPVSLKQILSLGVEIASYRRAAERFEALTKLPLSKSSLGRLVQAFGGAMVAQQATEAEAMVKPPAKDEEIVWREIPEPDSQVMNVSIDGVMINIRGEGWKEVKTVTISAVEVAVALQPDEEKDVWLTHHSYRAGLWEAKDFAKQQWAEGYRRGLEKARQIVSVNDGAAWIWLIIAMCYAPCIEIIDWWHAVQKVWQAANSLWVKANPKPWPGSNNRKTGSGRANCRPCCIRSAKFVRVVSLSLIKSGPWSVIFFITADAWTISLTAKLAILSAVARLSRAARSSFKLA